MKGTCFNYIIDDQIFNNSHFPTQVTHLSIYQWCAGLKESGSA